MNISCPNCHKNPAVLDDKYGPLPCLDCTAKQDRYLRPGTATEFTTDEIKLNRSEFSDDIEQPHYKGALNKKFVDVYGEQAARDRGFSQQEIDNAEYVMDGVKGIRYYNERT